MVRGGNLTLVDKRIVITLPGTDQWCELPEPMAKRAISEGWVEASPDFVAQVESGLAPPIVSPETETPAKAGRKAGS